MVKITGQGVIEKGRNKNTWLITHYLGEVDANGKYKRAPRRTVRGKKSDAYRALEEYRQELEGTMAIVPIDITVADYAWQFHELRAGEFNSPLSYKREELDIRHIAELFPEVQLQEITAEHIRKVYANARKKKLMSEDALHKTHVKLRQVLQTAFIDEKILRNPAEQVRITRPAPAERKSLSADEAARLYATLMDEQPTGNIIALLLMVSTGMRRSETTGLTWHHVDFERSMLFVAAQYGVDKKLRAPKSKGSRRWLSISKELCEVLSDWKQAQADAFDILGIEQTNETAVCTNDKGGFMDPNNLERWWRNYSVDHGFGVFTKDAKEIKFNGQLVTRGKGYEGLKLHELRHTQATLLIANRADWKTVQQRLGHAQASTTMNIYAHAIGANDAAAAATMDSILRKKDSQDVSIANT